ncbi:MAG: GTP cyclohydrolase I FolE [Anaerolineae bacterium]|nr:MAG: GTP cyclohydrolase I FolE [Anaerolineae bacterium]
MKGMSMKKNEKLSGWQVTETTEAIYRSADLFPPVPMNQDAIRAAVRQILLATGEDPDREGLQRTPDRVARAYDELLSGYRTDPVALVNDAIFEEHYDEMVLVRDIEFYSLCEHHMLPFIGRAHVAYIPNGRVIGLSKIPRIVDMFARRLQVQERLTRQVAEFLQTLLQPRGVAVIMEGVHMCSMMRGVKKHDSRMTTSTMLGSFRENLATRQEFLDNISRGAQPLAF